MVQTVKIEGVGTLDFPDGMSQDQIAHAIENELLRLGLSRFHATASCLDYVPTATLEVSRDERAVA